MAISKNILGDFLQETRILIGNSQNLPEVSAALAEFGYDGTRWSEGNALLRRAEDLVVAQRKEYGDQYEATEAVQAAWTTADGAYSKTLKIARLAFADDVQATTALKLSGPRKASLAGWLDQAQVFYGNLVAQPRLVAALAKYGYSAAKVTAEKALVETVHARVQAQAKETGEAQQATADRDAAVTNLDAWAAELRAVVKVALADRPQVLEMVGITVGTPGPKKKAASKPKAVEPVKA
jgi:hypothetical protein